MRTNKISGVLRTLTAMVLSIGLIAGPCYEFSSGGLVSLAASKESDEESLHAEAIANAEPDAEDSAYTETDNNADFEVASPSEMHRRFSKIETENQSDNKEQTNQESEPETKYKALIIVSAEKKIADSTKANGESVAAMLKCTNEFKNCSEDDISIMTFEYDVEDDQDDSDKQKVWKWIDDVADNQSGESLTIIVYTGHGYYGNDGTSELSIGGKNSITAAELKSHTAKLNGDVMLILNSCYAGGMIMPTAEGDETAEVDISKLSEQAQTEADKFSKSFVSEFKSANEPKYYIFAEASPYEMGWVNKEDGSGMIAMLQSGLGYDRNDEYYDIISADTDCDYKVTMAELAAWVKSGGCISEPTVAPAGSKHVLFTYDKDNCNAAMFSIEAIGDKSIKVVNNKVTVNVLIHNYTKEDVEIEFAAYKSNQFSPLPGNQSIEYIKAKWGDGIVMSSNPATLTINANKTTKGQLVFDGSKLADKLTNGGKYVIKAYGSDDNTERCFAFTSFTTTIGGSELAELPDKEALAIKSPACVSNALDAVKVSQLVPLRVVFDAEPANKEGSAACLLTAFACRLGDESEVTEKAYTVNKNGQPVDKTGAKISCADDDIYMIYENVRPTYNYYSRDNVDDSKSVTGSSYTDTWDVSDCELGYYALIVGCAYEDGTVQYKTTFVEVTDKATADKEAYKIGEYFVNMGGFTTSAEAVIINSPESDRTVAEVSRRLKAYLDEYECNRYIVENGMSAQYTVDSWWRYDKNKEDWVKLEDTDVLEPGNTYLSDITITLNENFNAKFTDGTIFTFNHHNVLADENRISKDGKQATVSVQHDFTDITSNAVKVVYAHNNQPVGENDELQQGQIINVYVDENRYSLGIAGALIKLDKNNSAGYTRYEVVSNENKDDYACIYVYEISNATDLTEGCGCAIYELRYDADNTPQGGGAEEDKDDAGDKSDNDDADDKGDNADKDDSSNGSNNDSNSSGNNGASDTAYNKRAARNSSGRMVSTAVSKTEGTVTGSWQRESDGTWHYALSGGGYAKGWNRINYDNVVRWFYFDDDKDMHTGWLQDNNRWYYLGGDGAMLTGWVKDKDAWYFLDADGSMHTGWLKDNDKWYYLGSDGAMLTGWIEDSGKRYYIGSEGILQTE